MFSYAHTHTRKKHQLHQQQQKMEQVLRVESGPIKKTCKLKLHDTTNEPVENFSCGEILVENNSFKFE